MLSSLLMAFKGGMEAALVIGIIISQLEKIRRKDLERTVYWGAFAGLVISIAFGIFSFSKAKELGIGAGGVFQGILMLAAAGLIAFFIVWINQNNEGSSSITNKVSHNTSGVGLFVLAFLSVFREGTELMVFNLTQIGKQPSNILLGSFLGVLLAIIVALIFFRTALKINLQFVFKALCIFLIIVGGKMFGQGLVQIVEAGGPSVLGNLGLIIFMVPSLLIFLKGSHPLLHQRN